MVRTIAVFYICEIYIYKNIYTYIYFSSHGQSSLLNKMLRGMSSSSLPPSWRHIVVYAEQQQQISLGTGCLQDADFGSLCH